MKDTAKLPASLIDNPSLDRWIKFENNRTVRVASGKVEIVQAEEDGSERVLSEADSGSFFGEMALLDDAARSATARAVEKTELAAFYRSDLLALAEEKSQLGVKIIMYLSQVVAERLRRTNRSLKEVRDELESVKVDSEEVDGA